jgi:protein SCO1/2
MKTHSSKLLRILGFPFLLFLIGCHSSKSSSSGNDRASHAFAAQGTIEKIAADRRQVTIHHETIPGYMIEMTMDFPVDNADELKNFVPGDKITFTLNVDQDRDWVSNVHRVGHTDPAMTGMTRLDDSETPKLRPGDKLPDSELIAEDGRHIHLSDFQGKVVALTFFFTRCPLPNYCPLMNRNFSQTRNLLLTDPKAPANWEFLSISFDSDFDQPATLASYGGFYRHNNPDRWLFAAAPPATLTELASPLGLVIMRQDSNISHNLRTVVVDSQGHLYRQFNDNLWTPRQLADAMTEAARLPASNSHSR